MNNDPARVRRHSLKLIKDGWDKYNVQHIWNTFVSADNSIPTHDMFNTPEHFRLHVGSCKGVGYVINCLAQKGMGKNMNQARGMECETVRDYERISAQYVNSMFFWCVDNGWHFNFDLYIAFLIKFQADIDKQGFGDGLIYKLLNMIPELLDSYLFMPQYKNTTRLNWEAPVDERRDGKVFAHDNEWYRLREWIDKRQTKVRAETRNVGPVF